jgi:hypothetical protein
MQFDPRLAWNLKLYRPATALAERVEVFGVNTVSTAHLAVVSG